MTHLALAAAVTMASASPTSDPVPGADGAYMPAYTTPAPGQPIVMETPERPLGQAPREEPIDDEEAQDAWPQFIETPPVPEVEPEYTTFDPFGNPLRYGVNEPGANYEFDLRSGEVTVRLRPD